MSPSRPSLVLTAGILLLASPQIAAQRARDLRAEFRAGQTFLTWKEDSASDVLYRVYRATSAINNSSDLASADFLGEVDDKSSRNQGRSLATSEEHCWVIKEGSGELSPSQGLFVHTVETLTKRAFYAVTSVRNSESSPHAFSRNAVR